MSQVVTQRCEAITGKRWAKEPRRCKHITSKSKYCWQHLKEKTGFRIKKSTVENAGLGLFITKPIANDKKTADYDGKKVISHDPNYGGTYVLQVKQHPPTFVDASKTNAGLGRWMNHKPLATANNKFVVYRGKAYMKSTKPIIPTNRKGEKELFVPYGDDYFNHYPIKKKGVRKRKVVRKHI